MLKSIIIGTAGHIDHGKTALVKALTGVDTDRLPEEKARGITIDIGFAHTVLDGNEISFIDVPGHERFIKNMLAGVGGIDLAMLVVAADESVMPQTREHFEICRLLGIQSGVIVINKSDLVDQETLQLVREEVKDLVHRSFLQNAPVFFVSSKTGEGIEQLKTGLASELKKIDQRRPQGVFRLPIDRVFILRGHGTIVTGTLLSGKIKKDSVAEILPGHRRVKIRSIHAHNQNVPKAVAGQRTALNLQGIEKEEIHRGDVLTEADFFENTSLLNVHIELLSGAKSLRHNSIVRFHHLTNDLLVRITLIGREVIEPGQSSYAQLRLQKPVFALYGDRFILRKHSPLITIGGGVIVDHMPAGRISRGDLETLEKLQRLHSGSIQDRLSVAVAERDEAGVEEKFLQSKLSMHADEIRQIQSNQVIFLKENPLLAISTEAEERLRQKMKGAVSEFHQNNSLLPGIPKEELRTRFFPHVMPDIFYSVLQRASGFKQLQLQKETVALFGRRLSLSQEEESLLRQTEEIVLRSGVSSDFFQMHKEMKGDQQVLTKLLHLLIRQGKVIKITDDYFLHTKTWEEMKEKIRSLKAKQSTFSVADFKAIFGISRKYAIPLLEQLDRESVTRRSGNERIIL